MINFNEYFETQGSLYLNNIEYKILTLESNPKDTKTQIIDDLSTEIVNNGKQLRVIFTRKVSHDPKVLFDLIVSFGALYTFKKEYINNDFDSIEFDTMLKNNTNRLFLNIISRTSQLISQITSSHGQNPIVTPPLFLNKRVN